MKKAISLNKKPIACIVLMVIMIVSMTSNIYASGIGWSFVDGGGTGGLNADTAKSGRTPDIASYNGELYGTWQETNGTAFQIRVRKYNGTSWSFVDGGGTTGLNKDVTQNAYVSKLAVYNNELYAAWMENNASSITQIRVKKYNGTDWSFVDGGGSIGLNRAPNNAASCPVLAVYNGALYAAWYESGSYGYQIRVKKYNGTSWSFVDGGGVYGLNINYFGLALNPTLAVYNNELYAAWQEISGSADQIRVKKYNGTSWVTVDGGGSTGLNKNTAMSAQFPELEVYDNALYLAWHEEYNSTVQIRMKKYDGIDWSFVDGGDVTGLNKDTAQNASYVSLEVYHGELYAAWQETAYNVFFQIRVKRFDGTSWSFADGGEMTGLNMINFDTMAPAQHPALLTFNDEIYAAWDEAYYNIPQIRVSKMLPLGLGLSRLSGTAFDAKLMVNSSSTQPAKLFFAEYRGTMLVKVQSVDVDLSQIGTQTFPFSLSQQNPGQNDSVSVFLWSRLGTMVPLCSYVKAESK